MPKKKPASLLEKIKVVESFKTTDGKTFEFIDQAEAHQKELEDYANTCFIFPWEYCECGCKGFELKIAGRRFWCTSGELNGKRYYYLGEGSSYASSTPIARDLESARAVDLALLPIAEEIVANIRRNIDDIERCTNQLRERHPV